MTFTEEREEEKAVSLVPESEELRFPSLDGLSIIPLKETTNKSSLRALQIAAFNKMMFSREA